MDPQEIVLFPFWYVAFLLSLTCHEAAHALAAKLGGDDTAYLAGQVTLNPIPHVRRELFGTVIVPILSYLQGGMMGWASAPYDPDWEVRHPRRAAAMALAGPAANLLIFLLALAALRAGLASGAWTIPSGGLAADRLVAAADGGSGLLDGLGRLLSILFYLNLLLLVFNLLPFPPMDGASVVAGWVSPLRELYRRFRSSPFGSIAGLVVAFVVFPVVFGPIVRWAVQVLLFG